MPTLDEIRHQIRQLEGSERLALLPEVKELPLILSEGEGVERIAHVYFDKRYGILVATNSRLLFVNKGLSRMKVEEFPYARITSVQYEVGLLAGKLLLLLPGNKAEIEHVPKTQVQSFAEFVRVRMSSPGNPEEVRQEATDSTGEEKHEAREILIQEKRERTTIVRAGIVPAIVILLVAYLSNALLSLVIFLSTILLGGMVVAIANRPDRSSRNHSLAQ